MTPPKEGGGPEFQLPADKNIAQVFRDGRLVATLHGRHAEGLAQLVQTAVDLMNEGAAEEANRIYDEEGPR